MGCGLRRRALLGAALDTAHLGAEAGSLFLEAQKGQVGDAFSRFGSSVEG